MYEHPMKRAGLSMNRILFSNTKMVAPCFVSVPPEKFKISFKFKTYENGKETSRKYFTDNDMEEVFPIRSKTG